MTVRGGEDVVVGGGVVVVMRNPASVIGGGGVTLPVISLLAVVVEAVELKGEIVAEVEHRRRPSEVKHTRSWYILIKM